MAKEYSPFTPGVPVSAEFFVGRRAEAERLRRMAAETSGGRLRVAFLSGERGIGKSSLAAMVRAVGERESGLLGLHTFLGGVSTLEELARRIFDRLLKESVGKAWHSKVKDFFGSRIREVGLFGLSMEFEAPDRDLRRLLSGFRPALQTLLAGLAGEKKGLFLVLDDINGLAEREEFAHWLKSLVDEIATSEPPCPLFLLLVGVEDKRQSLIRLQPSLARVFEVLEVEPLSQAECAEFFRTSFGKAGVTVQDGALETLTRFSGGLPVLAHEIGHATFLQDGDDDIDGEDAIRGVTAAADVVGRKHLEPQVFAALRSGKYRSILRKLAWTPSDLEFRRSGLRGKLDPAETKVLDNFLTRMKKLGVIRPDPGAGPGAYRFINQLHRVYFWLEAERARGTSPSA